MNNNQINDQTKHKAGYVSILGRPNVGKSTFLNQVLGIKLSITSPKSQTTRHRILGIHSSNNFQILFLDTPGMIKPQYLLQEFMMGSVKTAMEDSDLVLFMIEASDKLRMEDELILDGFKSIKKPILILINKIDLVKKGRLLPLIQQISETFESSVIIPISSLNKDGLEIVVAEIVARLPESPPYYPPEMLTEHPERFIVSEVIREKIFEFYGEEIPYSTTVVIDEFHEQEGKKDVISAIIFVERTSQKGILIGKNGVALKKIGESARKDIESFLQRPVFLKLWVKVKLRWRRDANAIREFGYGSKLPRK